MQNGVSQYYVYRIIIIIIITITGELICKQYFHVVAGWGGAVATVLYILLGRFIFNNVCIIICWSYIL